MRFLFLYLVRLQGRFSPERFTQVVGRADMHLAQ